MDPGRRIFTFPRVSAVLLTVQSVILLQFPLLNVLGLEFSIASAPLVALLAGIGVLRRPFSTGQERQPYRSLFSALRSLWYLYLIPGSLALANAVLVRNCSPLEGILTYVLVVPFAAAYGVSLALLTRTIAPRSFTSIFVLLWVLTLLHIPAVTFLGPQIFAFNPIVGFFPGLSFDSALSVIPSLAFYRCTTVLFLIAVLETVRCSDRPVIGTLAGVWRAYRTVLASWSLVLAVWFSSDALGFSSSLTRIQNELQGTVTTEHFVVIYPKHRLREEEAARFGEYHEFLYRYLSRTLRVRTSRRIIAVYYDTPAQKAGLVGGGSTNFTKPWLWQMHLGFDDRDRVLKHELVHVLAAEFGFPLVRIGLNSGFIEGLSVALERESYGMPLDRAAAAILHVRGSADISAVFSLTGFFRSHASVSYTLAGSFCRFLIERYGMRSFKKAYGTGSFNAFGRPFEVLVELWQDDIARIRLTHGEILKARFLFDRPSTFTQECYRYKGNTLRDARQAVRSGQDSLAIVIAEETYRSSPSSEAAYVWAQALTRMGKPSEALLVLSVHAKNDSGTRYLPLSLIQGDALWAIDSVVEAREQYSILRTSDLSDGWTEAVSYRLLMTERYPADREVRDAVVLSGPDSVRRAFFRRRAALSDDPLIWYGLSRSLSDAEAEEEVMDVLSRALSVDDSFLRYATRRRLSGLLRDQKEYERGKAVLWEAQNEVSDEIRYREIIEEIDWMDWLKERGR